MTFTPNPPTREGAYWFKTNEHIDSMQLLEVYESADGLMCYGRGVHDSVEETYGLWSPRLVSVEEVELMRKEVEKAWQEGVSVGRDVDGIERRSERQSFIDSEWQHSRAREVVEGM